LLILLSVVVLAPGQAAGVSRADASEALLIDVQGAIGPANVAYVCLLYTSDAADE